MAIMRVTFTGTYLGQRCQNVLHFLNPDGALTDVEIREELLGNFVIPLRSLQNNQATWTVMQVQRVDGTPTVPSVFALSGHVGSLSGDGAPSFLAALVRIVTGVSGRHGHGRFYIWGVHGASVANGVFQSGALSAYGTTMATMTNRFKLGGGTGPIQMGVAPRSTPTDFIGMSSLVVPSIFGVQRRRNIGVGA
jgi:hypothetical protein